MTRTIRKKRTSPATQAGKRFSLRSLLLVIAMVAVVCAIGVYVVKFPKDPPTLPSDGVDKAIVAAVEAKREQVLDQPRSADAWGNMGMTLHAHDFLPQAATCYEQAARFDQKDPRWPYLHARCLSQTDVQQAIDLLNQSIALCSRSQISPRLYVIELLLESGHFPDARARIEEVLQRDPNNLRARHAKARWLFINGDFQACKVEILSIDSHVKRMTEDFQTRAKNLTQAGHRAEAEKFVREANRKIQANLRKQKTLGLLLARAMRQLGDIDASEKQRQRSEKLSDLAWNDDFMSPLARLRTGRKSMLVAADLAFGRKDYDGSIATLKKVIADYPDSLFAYTMLGRAYIRKARDLQSQNRELDKVKQFYDRAESFLDKGLELDKNSVEALFRLGVIFSYRAELEDRLENYKRAESHYRRCVQLKDDFTMAHFNLANALDQQGKLADAIEAMRGAVRSEPNHVEARDRLAYLLLSSGQLAEAKEHAEIASRLAPNNRQVQKTLEQLRAKELGLPGS